jgi:hypothetical protein
MDSIEQVCRECDFGLERKSMSAKNLRYTVGLKRWICSKKPGMLMHGYGTCESFRRAAK